MTQERGWTDLAESISKWVKKWLPPLETNQIPDCQKWQRYLRVQETELRKPCLQRTIQFTGHNFAIGGSKN